MNPIHTIKDAMEAAQELCMDSWAVLQLWDTETSERHFYIEFESKGFCSMVWEDAVNGTYGREFHYINELAELLLKHKDFINASGQLEAI